MDQVPLVLMTGFGYDPGHLSSKARQAGLQSHAVLYKPFVSIQLWTPWNGHPQTPVLSRSIEPPQGTGRCRRAPET